ncbi:hypothetical protein HZH66_008188 [Vespula vulgaris]|uniref:Peptidase S8 pro-domain domain-containing protein n=1 Tax=Vespula vulgaris TaxID=7454 RepID=A0A834N4U0_VESVU|nr:hypothetical protein HZH66_008188 [Vespula vulgaris]
MCTRRIFGLACLALLMTLRDRVGAYTNQWAAHIEGGPEVAKKVAEDHGFRYLAEKLNDKTAKVVSTINSSLLFVEIIK